MKDKTIRLFLTDGVPTGVFNCWQAANPDQTPRQTLRRSRDRTIAYHCDRIFVPRSWQHRLHSCTVLDGDDWNRLSNHNLVLTQFVISPN